MKQVRYVCVMIVALGVSLFAASDRYLVENQLMGLAQSTLDAMFGKHNFIVRVQVEMTESKYAVNYTKESTPKAGKKKKKETVYLMPGVPVLQNIAPASLNTLPYDSVTRLVTPKVQKIGVYVLVDKAFERAKVRRAEAVLKDILGFKEGRDIMKIQYKPFYIDPNKEAEHITILPGPEKLLSIQNLFYVLVLMVLVIFMGLYFRMARLQLKQGNKSSQSDGMGGSMAMQPAVDSVSQEMNDMSSDGTVQLKSPIKLYFDFITEQNYHHFIFLLTTQPMKPEYIAYVLSFLPSRLGTKILVALDETTRVQVTVLLAEQRLAPKQILDKLALKLRMDMECFVGGDDKIAGITEGLPHSQRAHIITTLQERNPAVLAKIRRHLLVFDDLLVLESTELQFLLAACNLETVAMALLNVDQRIFDHIMTHLTQEAAEMVKQYLKLKSQVTSDVQREQAQSQLLKNLKQMSQNGAINLADKLGKG